jgi:hypothetical protein
MTHRNPRVPCCICQGNGKIGGVHCPDCHGSGDRAHVAPTRETTEPRGPLRRLYAAQNRPEKVAALHAVTLSASGMDGPQRSAHASAAIDGWIEIGEMGEARIIARDFWRDLPDGVLLRAGATDEIAARRRLRHFWRAPDEMDADNLASMAEMPGGAR